MAMTQFEKAVINELKGIKKELHELNKPEPQQGQVDGLKSELDGQALANSIGNAINSAEIRSF